jgi:hypothetical protein
MNIPAGLVTMACRGGTYTDEATQIPNTEGFFANAKVCH